MCRLDDLFDDFAVGLTENMVNGMFPARFLFDGLFDLDHNLSHGFFGGFRGIVDRLGVEQGPVTVLFTQRDPADILTVFSRPTSRNNNVITSGDDVRCDTTDAHFRRTFG